MEATTPERDWWKHPFATLFLRFEAYHEDEPWRLEYIGAFGMFAFTIFYFVRFIRPHPELFDDLWLRVMAVLLMLGLASRRFWPARHPKRYLVFAYWCLVLGLAFPVILTALLRGGGVPSISNSFIVLVFLVLLSDWRNTVAILLIAIALAIAIYLVLPMPHVVPRDLLTQIPAYLLILAGAAAVERRVSLVRIEKEARMAALRDSVGFLAHELNTPLSTTRTFIAALREDYLGEVSPQLVQFREHKPGEVLKALDSAEQLTLYCQSLISTVAQSARSVMPDTGLPVHASRLVADLLDQYPFVAGEQAWISNRILNDFVLPGGRDLLYLVLSTLLQNALTALRDHPTPHLEIVVGRDPHNHDHGFIIFRDNGLGIEPELLRKLTHQQVSTRSARGAGMGLLFARRVMLSLGGRIEISSTPGQGADVALHFGAPPSDIAQKSHASGPVPLHG